jgi:hypothetical protein
MQTSKFKIRLGRSQAERLTWGGLLVELKWLGADELYVTVEGDGRDLEEWISARRDVFGSYERIKTAGE